MHASRREIAIAVIVIVVLSLLGYAGGKLYGERHTPVFQNLAACVSKDPYGTAELNPVCVTQTIRSLLKVYSTAEVMKYISAPTTSREITINCHAIGHVVGQQTFLNTGSVQGALNQCTRDCAFGCIHGVIGAAVVQQLGNDNQDIEHADIGKIEAIGSTYCAQGADLCHAMGHLLYMNAASETKALVACGAMGQKPTNTEACYQGVFMEDAGEQSPTGPATPLFLSNATATAPVSQDYAYPCRDIAAPYQHACFMNLFFFQENLFSQHGVAVGEPRLTIEQSTCETLSGTARSDCFEGVGYLLYLTFPDSPYSSYGDYCATLTASSDRKACILGFATNLTGGFSYAPALNYCQSLTDQSERVFCSNAAFQDIHRQKADTNIPSICEAASAPAACEGAFKSYIEASSTLPNYYLGIGAGTN